jgi:hypothetical protein
MARAELASLPAACDGEQTLLVPADSVCDLVSFMVGRVAFNHLYRFHAQIFLWKARFQKSPCPSGRVIH